MEDYNNYPILMKTKVSMNLGSSSSMSSFNPPWEEVGLVWPPRFYSCNFCRREFRSAQALGGHMNVHRRDRAKLKQSYTPEEVPTAFSKLKTTAESTRKLNLVDGEVVMCKRYKKTGAPYLYCSSSREEIDLELRLGDPPAVK